MVLFSSNNTKDNTWHGFFAKIKKKKKKKKKTSNSQETNKKKAIFTFKYGYQEICDSKKLSKMRNIGYDRVKTTHRGHGLIPMSQLMRLWHFSSSVNLYFKRAWAAIQWG